MNQKTGERWRCMTAFAAKKSSSRIAKQQRGTVLDARAERG
jgi:hypothetical protein